MDQDGRAAPSKGAALQQAARSETIGRSCCEPSRGKTSSMNSFVRVCFQTVCCMELGR